MEYIIYVRDPFFNMNNSDVCVAIGLPYLVILINAIIGVKLHQYIVYDIFPSSDFHSESESEVRMPIFHLCHMLEPDLCKFGI